MLQELLDARHDLATVLGFASYGDMQVREGDRMLGSRTNVTAFLDAVRDRLRPEVEREAALMRRELGQMEQKEEEDETTRTKASVAELKSYDKWNGVVMEESIWCLWRNISCKNFYHIGERETGEEYSVVP